MRAQVRKHATGTKFSADTFADAIGDPLPAWLLHTERPGPGTLVAAEVAPDGWSAVLTVDIPEPR